MTKRDDLVFDDLYRIYCAGFTMARLGTRTPQVDPETAFLIKGTSAGMLSFALGVEDGSFVSERGRVVKSEGDFCAAFRASRDSSPEDREATMRKVTRIEEPDLSQESGPETPEAGMQRIEAIVREVADGLGRWPAIRDLLDEVGRRLSASDRERHGWHVVTVCAKYAKLHNDSLEGGAQ